MCKMCITTILHHDWNKTPKKTALIQNKARGLHVHCTTTILHHDRNNSKNNRLKFKTKYMDNPCIEWQMNDLSHSSFVKPNFHSTKYSPISSASFTFFPNIDYKVEIQFSLRQNKSQTMSKILQTNSNNNYIYNNLWYEHLPIWAASSLLNF